MIQIADIGILNEITLFLFLHEKNRLICHSLQQMSKLNFKFKCGELTETNFTLKW